MIEIRAIVFLIALVTALALRLFSLRGSSALRDNSASTSSSTTAPFFHHKKRTKKTTNRSEDTLYDVKALFYAPVESNWIEVVWHLFSQASNPQNVHVGVLLECTKPSDAELIAPPELQHAVTLVHVNARKLAPGPKHDELLRRFLRGDETVVVLLHRDIRLRHGWDETLVGLRREFPSTRFTVPASCSHEPTFPCLAADGTRDARDRTFVTKDTYTAVPSVCVCAEFVAGPPAAWAQSSSFPYLVPTFSMLEVCSEKTWLRIFQDVQSTTTTAAVVSTNERVGLTPRPTEWECVCKYGTVRAAKLAGEFCEDR